MKRFNLKSTFLKSLAILASGSLIAQLFTAVQQPMLTRIFSAEQLGAYTFLMSIPMTFVGVICARYDAAIVYEEDEAKVFPLIKLNLLITVALSLLVSLLYAVYLIVFNPEYIRYLYLMPVICLYLIAYGITNILNAYNNRNGDYKMISKMHVVRTAIQVVGVLVPGLLFVSLLHFDWLSMPILVLPFCLGMFFGVFTQARTLKDHLGEILHTPWRDVKAVARIHCKQPLLSMPAVYANSMSYSVITLFIEGLYTKAALGYYSISTRLLGMPLSLISGNVSKVYMEKAAKEYAKTGGYYHAFKKTFLFLLALALPMFLVMFFLAPPVCGWLFGEGWDVAGRYIRILAFMFSVRFIATALSPGLYVCRKQQYELAIQILMLAASAAAGVVAFATGADIERFLVYVCLFKSVGFLMNIAVVYVFSKPSAHAGKRKEIRDETSEENLSGDTP